MKVHELSGDANFSFHVLDVDCPNCARNIENAIQALDCVEDASLIYATQTLDVIVAPGVDEWECKRQVLETVRSFGDDLELTTEERVRLSAERSWFAENRAKVLMLISGIALVAGMVTEHLLGRGDRAIPLYVIAACAGLVYVAPMAIAALKRHTADMNVLMGIAVLGALVMGFFGDESVFEDAAIVIFLDQVGEWLEGWSMRKTAGSIKDLMDLAPSVAHVVSPDGTTVDVETKGVEEGYTIRVLPGERIPLDGTIVAGSSSFNEAPVTGESMPQDKGIGEDVFAGSLNTNSVVDILVTADEDCSTLARIVSQVQGAQAAKAPYESFVNRFAAAYTPIVVVGALLIGILVPLSICFMHGGFDLAVWHDWAYRACSLLVVACPCALVISTPVSFVSALSCAAKTGILVKGGAYFDIGTHVDTVAFDKTGTLTTGSTVVSEVVAFGVGEDEVVGVAAALEGLSTHPLARSVSDCARERNIAAYEAVDVEELMSQGMRGRVAGAICTVGKPDFAATVATVTPEVEQAVSRLGARGATALVVTRADAVIGVIGVSDALRESASDTVGKLAVQGRSTCMLTGDNAHVAAAVAGQVGVSEVCAELLPADKLNRIKEMRDAGSVVAMVGDGINDAPALAAADLGITMGAAASDTALEVADVALLSDSLEQLPAFFALATRTMNVVRENIVFAIGVKVIVFVLVVLGMAGMGAAVFADTGVALIVVLNGMRLMRPSKLKW